MKLQWLAEGAHPGHRNSGKCTLRLLYTLTQFADHQLTITQGNFCMHGPSSFGIRSVTFPLKPFGENHNMLRCRVLYSRV